MPLIGRGSFDSAASGRSAQDDIGDFCKRLSSQPLIPRARCRNRARFFTVLAELQDPQARLSDLQLWGSTPNNSGNDNDYGLGLG